MGEGNRFEGNRHGDPGVETRNDDEKQSAASGKQDDELEVVPQEERPNGALTEERQQEEMASRRVAEGEESRVLTESFALTIGEEAESGSEDTSDEGAKPPVQAIPGPTAETQCGEEESKEQEQQGAADNEQDQPSNTGRSAGMKMVGAQCAAGRRAQSPTTHAVENQFRKIMQELSSSIEAATSSLKETLSEVLRGLLQDQRDSEKMIDGRLQAIHVEAVHKGSQWLTRHREGELDRGSIDGFELRPTQTDEKCREVVTNAFQDQCATTARRVKEMIDGITDAFESQLEEMASTAKQQFRWIKRMYREKIDVHRNASKIELKDTLLLDRCILEETTRNVVLRHEEGLDRMRIEFQLERSAMRKQRRDLEQSVEVLQLEKLRAEQDAAQAHRYIETLEEGAGGGTIHGANHSEDGSIGGARSHRHSRRTTAATPRTGGISSSRPGSRGGSPRHTSAAGASGGGQQGSRRASRGHNHLPSQPTSVVSVGGGGGGLNTARQAMAVGGGVADGVGRHADLSARGSARGASNGGMLTGGFHSTAGPGLPRTSGSTGGGLIDKQHTARGADRDSARLGWAGAGLGVDGQVSARGLGSSRGLSTARTGLPHNGGEINPAARHEEARKKFDEDASNKLMRVIEKKKMDNLKEELADEKLAREAAQGRLEQLEQAIPKLHEDLQRIQEQLVQSRMETNELRKITTVLTADAVSTEASKKRDKENSAAALWAEGGGTAGSSGASGGGDGGGSERGKIGIAADSGRLSLLAVSGGILRSIMPGRNYGGTVLGDRAALRKTRGLRQCGVQQSAPGDASSPDGEEEERKLEGTTAESNANKEVTRLKNEKAIIIAEVAKLREEAEARENALLLEEGQTLAEGPVSPRTHAAARLQLTQLAATKRDLESKVARMQIASDENQYLRRRLEAIERTALKLNLGGPSAEIQGLKERLELESAEVLRLRETVYALKADKIAMADATAKMYSEYVSRAEFESVKSTSEEQTALLEAGHREEVARMEEELGKLTEFKAHFENLADSSLHDGDSDGLDGDSFGSGGGDGGSGKGETKWKQRAKKLKQFVQWQLAEAEAQARRDRAEMSLKTRSHEILVGEMAVTLKGYRAERARLYEVNRTLRERLARSQGQPLSPTTHSPTSPATGRAGLNGALPADDDPPALCKKRNRSGGGLQRDERAVPPTPIPPSVRFVAVHSIENTRGFAGFVRDATTAAGPVDDATTTVHQQRPQTTGCCNRPRKNALDSLGQRKGTRRDTATHETPLTVRVGAIARQLRSKVRDEFLGRPETFGGSGRLKEIVSATTRYTTRESMVLARPFSAVTGSVRTNVPLPGDDGGGGWTGNPRPDGKVVATASGFGGLGPVDIDGGGRFW